MTSIYDFYETRFGVIPTMLALRLGAGSTVGAAAWLPHSTLATR